MSGTGLLTDRCDPFGTESGDIRLAGGVFPASQMGRIIWKCEERAVGRFRMICTGGEYGQRIAPDGGTVAGYVCDGGHKGQVIPLCKIHVRQFSVGPRAPGWNRDRTVPHGIVGGTVANELCPACAWPPEARELQAQADALHQEISQYEVLGMLLVPGKLLRAQADVTARLNELNADGRVHKCPLRLVEVS